MKFQSPTLFLKARQYPRRWAMWFFFLSYNPGLFLFQNFCPWRHRSKSYAVWVSQLSSSSIAIQPLLLQNVIWAYLVCGIRKKFSLSLIRFPLYKASAARKLHIWGKNLGVSSSAGLSSIAKNLKEGKQPQIIIHYLRWKCIGLIYSSPWNPEGENVTVKRQGLLFMVKVSSIVQVSLVM